MQAAIESKKEKKPEQVVCYHCGTPCAGREIGIGNKFFCCEGCKLVYEVINQNGLCNYYVLGSHPGLSQVKSIRNDKYAYLDDDSIAKQLLQFTDGDNAIVNFYIPGVHCSSCMWLLEHLGKIDKGIGESHLNFSSKEVTIRFSRKAISLRKLVELLATIGYEPYISLDDAGQRKTRTLDKGRIIKLGVAGFCFGNIMMMSFPEYLASKAGIDVQYAYLFRYLNLFLALPVFFYSASEFFVTAWQGLKQKMLNIDAPIALAVIITFVRSVYEILSGTGAGFLDSMSGIVFFMLAGRLVQERTYKFLSFDRNYKSYFPIAVNTVQDGEIVSRRLEDLRKGDIVRVYNDEVVPADSILIEGRGYIDYSFVSGESEPQSVKVGDTVYAGGKQKGEAILISITKPVAGSYLTSLWNHFAFKKNKVTENNRESAIHNISRYFTMVLFLVAFATAAYWYFCDPSKIINSVSAMLIVACPCALLLAATFTNGNIMRILARNGLFLRDPSIIEQLGNVDNIVFDKTGTLTKGGENEVTWSGHSLVDDEKDIIYTIARNSQHPNSRALIKWLGPRTVVAISGWEEIPGKGVMARVGSTNVLIGSAAFTGSGTAEDNASVCVRIGDSVTVFHFEPQLRPGVAGVIGELQNNQYETAMLSGDNERQRSVMRGLFGNGNDLLFNQEPVDKLHYIEKLQNDGHKVLMLGDGLNDAGALQQSNVGITLSDDINNFTPSCDAILDAQKLELLPSLISVARSSAGIIRASFIVSVAYNLVGLYFSVQGLMKPVLAAILMPCSTLSIVIITTCMSSVLAYRKGMKI